MNNDIYEKYASKIYNYIYSLCKDNDIAEEILQDTFYCAIKNVDSFKGDSSIYTWLCKIAKNNWMNYLNRKNKIKFVSLEENTLNYPAQENIGDRQELFRIYEAMHKLDATTKEIVLLRLHSNLSFREIGDLFNKSEQWARTNFFRGKLKIRRELENE